MDVPSVVLRFILFALARVDVRSPPTLALPTAIPRPLRTLDQSLTTKAEPASVAISGFSLYRIANLVIGIVPAGDLHIPRLVGDVRQIIHAFSGKDTSRTPRAGSII